LGVQPDGLGTPGGVTLAEVFIELVHKTQGDVVLFIDEVQQAMAVRTAKTCSSP